MVVSDEEVEGNVHCYSSCVNGVNLGTVGHCVRKQWARKVEYWWG